MLRWIFEIIFMVSASLASFGYAKISNQKGIIRHTNLSSQKYISTQTFHEGVVSTKYCVAKSTNWL
jgi:hypothetical protein